VPGVPSNPTPARVINLSLGGEGPCTAAYRLAIDAITAAGTAIVAAAGNTIGHAVSAPANCPGVIAVAGVRHAGTKVGFSALGPEVTLSAPAGNCVNTAPDSECVYPILTTIDTGATIPQSPSYSDGFRASYGTSFSAPLVSGTIALMLSASPGLGVGEVKSLLQATTRLFPVQGAEEAGDSAIPRCTAPQYDLGGNPLDQGQCYCTSTTCGAGMLDTAAAVRAASGRLAVSPARFEGLWWNAPAGSESGWGLNVAQQGDVIFATWFTYDATGKSWWLSMIGSRLDEGVYAGALIETRGPPVTAAVFDRDQVGHAVRGDATLTFIDPYTGTFRYTVDGATRTKNITRQVFGETLTCTFALDPDPAAATTYQDLWWAAPAGSESGWGINLVQQSDIIFATWFVYDVDRSPLWLVMTATRQAPGIYGGTLYRTRGPSFDAATFDPGAVSAVPVGEGTLTFANGNSGTFAYTVNGVPGAKAIVRQVFRGSGTTCRD
jgi:subtilisin family serine protease